ncbi:hypothetical protein BDN70DRAFT_126000 [Pholiota conissans]|uniref:Uncharacterized protein n=1 Tax=Pholiota conissans TaxID=109636 RepID=A0A9P5ZAA7_9AGAR|nr:hypothetical protein BDN70DRAFT_126000 [Pholiota conissans]
MLLRSSSSPLYALLFLLAIVMLYSSCQPKRLDATYPSTTGASHCFSDRPCNSSASDIVIKPKPTSDTSAYVQQDNASNRILFVYQSCLHYNLLAYLYRNLSCILLPICHAQHLIYSLKKSVAMLLTM